MLDHLWQSTLFAGLAGLFTLALRKNRAQTRYWLWMAASVKFLIPFSLLVAAGNQVSWRRAASPAIAQTRFRSAMDQVSQPFSHQTSAETPSEVPSKTTPLMLLWASGLVAIGLRWWIRWRCVHTAVLGASPLSFPIEIEVRSSSAMLEPGVFGIFRPILLLPQRVAERLTPAQLGAIVAHEMCHIRRRDNMTTALHMIVEAIFWFHPLVWWLGARLVEERERACDEEVLRAGRDAQTYAEGILKVCEFYLVSPLECMAGVSGANLKKRIEEIMTNRAARGLSVGKKALLGCAGALAIAGPIAVGIVSAPPIRAQAQTGQASAFEVASVKPNPNAEQAGPGDNPVNADKSPGHFAMRNKPLRFIIEWAYDLKDYQITGPEWIQNDERYDITANAPGPATDDQMRPMLQALLAERFQMKSHFEKRELDVYALVKGKGEPKLKKADPNSSQSLGGDRGQTHFNNFPLSRLTFLLTRRMDRPALDLTGVTGNFDYAVDLSGLGNKSGSSSGYDGDGRSVFQAIQEDVGLKLEPRKYPVDILVIDSVNKVPSQN